MSDQSSQGQIASAAMWALPRALFLQFWKLILPALSTGATLVTGFLSSTPIPLMWIIFASAGVFSFTMASVLSLSIYLRLKTDAYKLRINSGHTTVATLGGKKILLFGVEMENLASFPIYFEAVATTARMGNITALPSDIHLSSGVIDPLGKPNYRSCSIDITPEMEATAAGAVSPAPPVTRDGIYTVSIKYGVSKKALRNSIKKDYRVVFYLHNNAINSDMLTDEKNLKAVT